MKQVKKFLLNHILFTVALFSCKQQASGDNEEDQPSEVVTPVTVTTSHNKRHG